MLVRVETKKLIRIKDQHVDWDVVRRLEVKGNVIIVHFENNQSLAIELDSPRAVWKELGNIANQFGYTAPPPRKRL